ncbi:MAG: hypothetical protein WA984_00400 [Phormidesmis sp.]
MNISFKASKFLLKSLRSSGFAIAFGSVLCVASAGKAQQPITGRVLGIETDGTRCNLSIIDDAGDIFVEAAEGDICEQSLVGSEIRLTYKIDEIEVIPPPTTATVTNLTVGDRACYVRLVDANGRNFTQFANFEICEQDIVGAVVALTYETGNITAFSCQGNIECGESETVSLIASADIVSRPTPSPEPLISALISALPNGNYRYWSGSSPNAIVTNEQLLANGGTTFLFRKLGNNVTGIFGYVDGEAICVQGQVNENTVTGISVQSLQGAGVISGTDTFKDFGPSGRIQVRRGRQINPTTIRYSSTLLNLQGLNRINAGDRLPPSGC